MFSHISLAGLAKSHDFAYAAKHPFFKDRKRIDFKPGLNVLFGPNGSGKSTIIRILAGTMCAELGGVSTITQSSLDKYVDSGNFMDDKPKVRHKVGLKVAHDGQPIVYCDPRERLGFRGGRVDLDFPNRIAMEVSNNGSHGEKSWQRVKVSIGALMGLAEFPSEIDRCMDRRYVNDIWKKKIDIVEAAMTATIEKGQPTILLDEPEANFSLIWQRNLWEWLSNPEHTKNFQIIVASHSPFSLGIQGANYIDLEPGYRAEVEEVLKQHFAP
jgi:predicted ATPase